MMRHKSKKSYAKQKKLEKIKQRPNECKRRYLTATLYEVQQGQSDYLQL